MNTQQLKELAKLADSEVTWILLPKDLANDGWCTEVVNYISVVSPSTITALVDRIEAAERERDELRAVTEEQSKLAGSNAARAQKAEAEIARRDAAAGEAVAHIIQDESCFPGMVGHIHIEFTPTCRDVKNNGTAQPLYTAAPPAVLSEIVVVAKAMRDWIDAVPKDVAASLPTMPGFDRDWADETIIAATGSAQQQKVVELPESFKQSNSDNRHFMFREDVIYALDAAGVKWEVKK